MRILLEKTIINDVNKKYYRFYMPHGLYVDFEGKVWVTDVGLHQVMKFDLDNMDKPELTLGS